MHVDAQRRRPRAFPAPGRRTREGPAWACTAAAAVSVGNLVPLKGHDLTIDAFASLLPEYPRAQLALVGAGTRSATAGGAGARAGPGGQGGVRRQRPPMRNCRTGSARRTCRSCRRAARACPTCCSSRWRAARRWSPRGVGGTREVVTDAAAGRLVDGATPSTSPPGSRRCSPRRPSRARVRDCASQFSWQATSQAQLSLFRTIAQGARHA